MKSILKLNPNERDIWLTSDTHYGHKNITRGVSSWEEGRGTRDFNTIREMNAEIVYQINEFVKEDDILIHLGDWSFGGIDNIWNFRKQLNVQNIFLVLGNHDHHFKNNKILPNCYYVLGEGVKDGKPHKNKYDFEKTFPITAQQLFNDNVYSYLEIEIEKNLYNCMHYPIEEWNDRGNSKIKNSYMIHGHQHGRNTYKENRIDVGLDNIYNLTGEYRPINYRELNNLMSLNEIHHD